MSDTWMGGMLAGMGSGLLAPAGTPSSYSAREMRQKIALAMLMRQRKYPKTFGEGLAAIGEAWGENSMAKSLERQAAEEAKAIETGAAAMPGLPTPSIAAPAPPVAAGPRAALTVPPAEDVADASAAAPAPVPPGGVHPNVASWHSFATRPFEQGGLGVAPHQAAGIVGNLQAESGPTIKPVGMVGDAGTAFGAAQWRNDRYANLQNFAKSNGMDPMTTEAQQAFMRHELRGSGAYGGGSEAKAFAALSGAQDPRSAAAAFDQSYERSSGAARGKRMAAAENLSRILADPAATPRDRVAAIAATRTADTPLTPADTAQEARVSDVLGMTRAPPSFGATASNRTGDVMSDMPPVTGALQGPLGASVGDTVQQRQQATQPPPEAAPPPPGPQLAQAGAFPPPPGPDAGGRIPAIIPGGGLPPAPPTAVIPAAPPDPRAAIRSAPPIRDEYVPPEKDPQPEPPAKPTMGPIEQQLTRDYLNKDIPPQLKAIAQQRIDYERGQLNAVYENQVLKYKADIANWQKRQEQTLGYRMGLPKQRAETEQSYATTGKTTVETERERLGLPKASAEADVAQLRADFEKRTGREREPFLKDLSADKEVASKVAGQLRQTKVMEEAIRNGSLSGMGADFKLNLNRVGAAIGSQDAAKVAAATEQYQMAAKSLISYGTMLVNGKDPRVTDSDVKQAQGITGDINLQRASQQKILNVMREDMHSKIADYEDKREYLRGDPQHRMFKVPVPETAPPAVTEALLKHRDDESIRRRYDADYGPGAAELEIKRAKRREQRAREDD